MGMAGLDCGRLTTAARRMLLSETVVCLAVIMLLTSIPRATFAMGKFISAPSRVDMVYDDARDVLYITNGSSVLRYDTTSEAFLTPFSLTGYLKGIDLSPDGNTLAVADTSYSSSEVWVYLVDLNTEQSWTVPFVRGRSEGGTFTVAFGEDGRLLVSSTYLGSGWAPLRRYDPTTGETSTIASIRQNSMLRSSADGSIIGFAESNISDGAWGRYRVSDGNIVFRKGYSNGTSWFNYEIAVSRDGTQYAIPTYGGTFIYDGNYAKIATIGAYASGQPMGVVYDPTRDIVYFPWATTTKIRAYSTTTFAQIAEYDFENTFNHPGNHAFTEGRLKMSSDGDKLFATVQGGVRYISFSGPPTADSKNVTTAEDQPVAITLTGCDVGGDPITYILLSTPAHGTLTGMLPNLTYTPEANYNGSDSFTFKVSTGTEDSAPATISITITPVNDPPLANPQDVLTAEDSPVAVTLTGSDADGDALNYSIVNAPAHGTLSGTLPNLTYTPAANYNGPDSFSFKVNDGIVNSAAATVSISVAAVNDPPTTSSQDVITTEDTPVGITLTGYDIDGDPLTYIVVDAPQHGGLSGTLPNLTYTPTANYNGVDEFTFKANDGTADSAPATVSISIAPVNDQPTFALAADHVDVKSRPKPVIIPQFAWQISPGPADESAQTVHFEITCSAPARFAVQPVIDSAGTLSFVPAKIVPAKNKRGTAIVMVRALDGGGTANGGIDESTPQSFRIVIK